ncbi:preprotein translocase subunit YajC [Pseudoscardovia suis]|uniref:Preprotein translocase n=1 Tax=Pseudoscardovia suis TaxID=987063 RepID=A0A261ESE8_9BIFI|nr:preprotein translocase subunit YajC [Pseudoscardovia suis]OZG49586.1 preprotein translocase [Pseudoscardovia suis]PJJ69705.1 preprotein translocase subunit YajC [Pseudoscardovia suis]
MPDITTIVILVLLILMMVWMGHTSKKQQQSMKDRENWRQNLEPGDKVATQSGLLAEVVEVLPDYDEIVLKSEDSTSRWRLAAITEPPVRPAYIPDEEDADNSTGATENADATENTDATDAADEQLTDNSSELNVK